MERAAMCKIEIIKRYAVLMIGLFFSALGVALTKYAELGVSPISSVANVMSCKFSFVSLGTWLIIWNCVLILGQILLLRKKFSFLQLLQIPLSFLFGWFTDISVWLCSFIPLNSYLVCLVRFSWSLYSWLWGFTFRNCKCNYEFRGSFCKSSF